MTSSLSRNLVNQVIVDAIGSTQTRSVALLVSEVASTVRLWKLCAGGELSIGRIKGDGIYLLSQENDA